MGRKGFALIFAALMMVVGGTVYAGSHMVVVFDVESGDVVKVYDAKSSGVVAGGKITFDANGDGKAGEESIKDRDFMVNKKGKGKTISKITEKTKPGTGTKGGAYGIPDYTVIFSAASPGCITYTWRGISYTVCN
jgi:hypothetical protein